MLVVIICITLILFGNLVIYYLTYNGQFTWPEAEKLFKVKVIIEDATGLEEIKLHQNLILIRKQNSKPKKAILYFSSHNRYELTLYSARYFAKRYDAQIYICNHYGFPQSQSYFPAFKTSKKKLLKNAKDCLNLFIDNTQSHTHRIVFGQSLGAYLALYSAALKPDIFHKVVLLSPLTSTDIIIQNIFGSFFKFKFLIFMRPKLSSWEFIPNVTTQTHILIPEKDSIIPTASQIKLAQSFARAKVNYKILKNKTHFDLIGHPAVMKSIDEVLNF